jgi:aminopeptidase N
VKVSFDYSDEELMFLMAHDSDGFNRWDAAQRAGQAMLLNLIDDPGFTVPQGYINACRVALTDNLSDKALLAEILTLPAETYLGDQMEVVDVDAIHRSRESLKTLLANELKDDLIQVYQANTGGQTYAVSQDAIARRSLRNLALGYLMQLNDGVANELCIKQYRAGQNMTDVISALGLIANSELPEREELLADFYARWKDDQLVLDKWFTVQASSKRSDTLTKVKELMQHPDFTMRNPNRVRSLLGAFCSANQVNFHVSTGSGYALLGAAVLQLDPINPQIAARMLRTLSRWRRYDQVRQRLMQQQLEKIVNTPGISKDVYEVASKSLG